MGLRKSTSINKIKIYLYVLLIVLFSICIVKFITVHTEVLRKTLEYLSDLLGVSIKYEWMSKEPSNINLYQKFSA